MKNYAKEKSRKIFIKKNRWACSFWIFNVNNWSIWRHRHKECIVSRKKSYEKFFKRAREKHIEKKNMLPLTKEELKSRQDVKLCYPRGKRILKRISKSINYWKVRDHCHYTGKCRGSAHSICNLKFNVPNETLQSFITV